jgi:hypothetical protein
MVLCFALSSCSFDVSIFDVDTTSEFDTLKAKPLPLPNFIGGLAPSPGATGVFIDGLPPYFVKEQFAKGICISLNEGADELWEPGDPPEKTDSFWRSHLQLKLDGDAIPFRSDQPLVYLGSYIVERSAQGQIIRKFSAAISTCFTTDLAIGRHVATVAVTTNTRRTYSYSWAFRVDSIQ